MAYGDFLKTISERFEALYSEIEVGYNYDYGPEFEIAICKLLRMLLPSRFGICRGFAVSLNGCQAVMIF